METQATQTTYATYPMLLILCQRAYNIAWWRGDDSEKEVNDNGEANLYIDETEKRQ